MNTDQSGDKALFDLVKFFQCQDRITHLAVFETPLKNFAHLAADRFRSLVLQRTDRRFTGISQTEDRQLLLPGRKSPVAEEIFVNDRIRIFRLGFGVEKVNKGIPVVAADGIADQTVQPVCPGKTQAFDDMAQNDLSTPGGSQLAVELIAAAVVLNEITGVFQFADVMEKRRCLGFEGIGTDGVGGIFGKGRHGHGVKKSAGGFTLHPLKQRMVVIAEHHKGHIGGNIENKLKEKDQYQRQHR